MIYAVVDVVDEEGVLDVVVAESTNPEETGVRGVAYLPAWSSIAFLNAFLLLSVKPNDIPSAAPSNPMMARHHNILTFLPPHPLAPPSFSHPLVVPPNPNPSFSPPPPVPIPSPTAPLSSLFPLKLYETFSN